MSEEITLKIKKDALWKYATFVLLAAVVILVIFMVAGGNGNGSTNYNNQGAQAAAGNSGNYNLEEITSNTEMYPSLGPVDAAVTVVEFADFQCPYCAIASGLPSWVSQYPQYADLAQTSNIERLAKEGKLRFVYVSKNFLGDESTYAAQAGLCANEQGKFWELHDLIFAAHDSSEGTGKYEKDKLKQLAAQVSGLNQKQFANCLDDDDTLDAVRQIESSTSGIGTPMFLINGQQVQSSWSQMSQLLEALGVDTN